MYTLKEPPKYFDVLGWFFTYLITEITRCSSPFKIPIEQFTNVVANYIRHNRYYKEQEDFFHSVTSSLHRISRIRDGDILIVVYITLYFLCNSCNYHV